MTATPCPAHKRKYSTRRVAKDVARRFKGDKMRPYRCEDHWHLGHLPPAIVEGRLGVPDIFGWRA